MFKQMLEEQHLEVRKKARTVGRVSIFAVSPRYSHIPQQLHTSWDQLGADLSSF